MTQTEDDFIGQCWQQNQPSAASSVLKLIEMALASVINSGRSSHLQVLNANRLASAESAGDANNPSAPCFMYH